MAAVLVTIVALFIAFCGMIYWNQEGMIFHPSRTTSEPPSIPGFVNEELTIRDALGEGGVFYAWHIVKPGCRKCVFFFGGNAHSMAEASDRLRWIALGLGCSVLTMDYPGYGKNPGKPGEKSIGLLAAAWGRHLRQELGYRPEDILAWGHSIGGGAAARFAEENGAGGLVLEDTFTSLVDIAGELYPMLPVSLLCRHPFEVRARLLSMNIPVAIAHSRKDELFRFSHAEALFEAADKDKRLLIELSGDHNNAYLMSSEDYLRKLRAHFPAWVGQTEKGT